MLGTLLLRVTGCALLTALASFAQDTPHYEIFVGGSYLRVHGGGSELSQLLNLSPVQYEPHNINLNLYGWEGTVIENVNHWLGGEVDAGGFYGTPNAGFVYPASELLSASPNFSRTVPVITRDQTVLFGPRFSLRKHGMVFFAHVPAGIANVNTGLNEPAVIASNFKQLTTGTIKSSTGFAISPGVGMDVRINSLVSIRILQVDYLMTHAFAERQDNFRISAGINFTLGEK
jgi:hypothetical protein